MESEPTDTKPTKPNGHCLWVDFKPEARTFLTTLQDWRKDKWTSVEQAMCYLLTDAAELHGGRHDLGWNYVMRHCAWKSEWDACDKQKKDELGAKHLSYQLDPNTLTIKVAPVEAGGADMPDACLDGWLGNVCRDRMGDFPRAYAWSSLLAAASALVHPETRSRCNLYVATVGRVGTGKSSCDNFAFHLLSLHKPWLVSLKAGSAEGLAAYIGDASGAARLLYPDELAHLLEKSTIERSSFPRILTSAFYNNEESLTIVKGKVVKLNARLSILGGIVEEQFGDLFGAATTGGLYDRFLFGLCPAGYKHFYRDRLHEDPAYKLPDPGGEPFPVPVTLHKSVFEERDRWIRELKIEPRVAELCLRAATICAGFNGQHTLASGMLKPALALAQYQMRTRILLQPNPGENPDARCAFKIRNWLELNSGRGRWVTRRTLQRGIHAGRLGPGVFNRCLLNLRYNGEIEEEGKKVRLVEEKK